MVHTTVPPPPGPPPPPTPPVPPRPSAPLRRRRRGLAWLGAALVVALVVGCGAVVTTGVVLFRAWAPVSTVGTLDFANELRIPPLASSTVDADGVRVFGLRLQEGSTSFRPGPLTSTWGYDGTYLAPTLRAERGERVRVEVTNGVGEPTTVHWHGMHLPPAQDGTPHQPIAPGATWTPSWTVDQPAATLWFHPHPHERTGDQVHRGAAGLFIVDEPEVTERLGLPSEYGVDDVPLVVQDRAFDDANQFTSREPLFGQMGPLGDELLVNGTWNPHLDVTTERIRLRVLNASNARLYDFRFDDARSFDLIASDGGLLERPEPMTSLLLTPGERAEIVVTMAPGERAVLRSDDVDERASDGDDGRFVGIQDSFDVLELRAADELRPSPPVPSELAVIDRPDAGDATTTRTFALDNNRINSRQMDMDRIDAEVPRGTTEVWEVTNRHNLPHSFHPHLTSFVVASIDDRPPPPELSGWKDTVFVPPGSTVRLVLRFDGPSDGTPSMFHCHILRHEDSGMMGQFVVVDPAGSDGGGPGSGTAGDGHGDHGG